MLCLALVGAEIGLAQCMSNRWMLQPVGPNSSFLLMGVAPIAANAFDYSLYIERLDFDGAVPRHRQSNCVS